jgi:hypothetical protein
VYLLWGLPFIGALLLAFFSARRRETSWWPCIGILATCFVGALTNFSFDFPPTATAPSMGAGLGIDTDNLAPVLVRMLSTAPLALVCYLWVRHTQRRQATLS